MLDKMFLQALNMSFTGGMVILLVLVLRLFLKKTPKIFSYALWGVVLFRLICPYSFESIFSLLPIKSAPISPDIAYMAVPQIDTGILVVNQAINATLPAATPDASVNPLQIWIFLGSLLWILGMAILLTYGFVTLLRVYRRLSGAVHEGDNVYFVAGLETPFVMGLLRPKIYLPITLSTEERAYILLHEKTHIKRYDHIIRMLSFCVLAIHWFNPLVWLAFFLSNKDMEMACDEAVIGKMGSKVKKDYSSSLLSLAAGKPMASCIPPAFGKGDTKGRIKNVLNYKKPGLWMVTILMVVLIGVSVGCMTNPKGNGNGSDTPKNGEESSYGAELLAGYIFIEGNSLYLDPVEIIKIEDEDRRAELGLSGQNDLPNGYHIHNLVTETMSFKLTDNTVYTFTDFNLEYVKEADGNRIYQTTKLEEFVNGSAYPDLPLAEQKIPYFLEVHDGQVISITEEFIYTQ